MRGEKELDARERERERERESVHLLNGIETKMKQIYKENQLEGGREMEKEDKEKEKRQIKRREEKGGR